MIETRVHAFDFSRSETIWDTWLWFYKWVGEYFIGIWLWV